eukprot:1290908-Amphidinium_carterae.1
MAKITIQALGQELEKQRLANSQESQTPKASGLWIGTGVCGGLGHITRKRSAFFVLRHQDYHHVSRLLCLGA